MLSAEWVVTQQGITLLSFHFIQQTAEKFNPFALFFLSGIHSIVFLPQFLYTTLPSSLRSEEHHKQILDWDLKLGSTKYEAKNGTLSRAVFHVDIACETTGNEGPHLAMSSCSHLTVSIYSWQLISTYPLARV
jgi:hypothetical protein